MSLIMERLFQPANARILGVARVAVGVAALMELAMSAPRILTLADPETIRLPLFEPTANLFYEAAPIIVIAWLLAGIAFMIGLVVPLAGLLLAAVMFGLVTADQQLYSNHSYLIAIAVFLLTAAGAGSSFSLDARRHGTDRESVPAWTLGTLRVQVTIVYLFAVAAKLNPSFLSGSVIAASLRHDGPLGLPEAWASFAPMFVLSILTIASELFLMVALWLRRWRPLAFVVGLGLHGMIVLILRSPWELATFGVVTLAMYLAFVDAPRRGHAVVWDDSCGFCANWVKWFRRLDWLDTLRFVPRSRLAVSGLPVSEEAALEAIHVVGPRRTGRAFGGVVDVLSVLPISFLWAPVLRIPPVAAIGEHVYAGVARSRTCPVSPQAYAPETIEAVGG